MRPNAPILWSAVLLALALAVLGIRRLLAEPSVSWLASDRVSRLASEPAARWLLYPDAFSHRGKPAGTEIAHFRKRFSIASVPPRAELSVTGFKHVVLLLDKATIPVRPYEERRWKQPITIDLAPLLTPGEHEIQIAVLNWNAHAAAIASCQALLLSTDATWETSRDGNAWTRARCADQPERVIFPEPLPTAAEACARQAWWMVPCFLGVAAWSWLRSRGRFERLHCTPARLRWFLVAAWVVLGAHNLLRLPLDQGFDVEGHLEYVHYVGSRLRLPLANEGWEMYQAPLFYVLSAALERVVPGEAWLRLLPLLCGVLQIEVAHRALRRVFRDRSDLRCAGLWIAALLPVNLYVSQVVGNEPLSALTTAVVVLLCLKALDTSERTTSTWDAIAIGVALGAALLAKMSAVLWVPLCALALVLGARSRGERALSALKNVAVAWTVAALLSGWFYARNWIVLGKPLVANWDWKEANRIWWQDPGYRIPEHFTRFGRSLVQPVYAAVQGFWDGLYSTTFCDGLLSGSFVPPPWDVECMIAGAWLGVPITFALAAGSLRRTPALAPFVRFAGIAFALHLLAQLYLYVRIPIYSILKGSYFLGLLPCFAILAAAGLQPLLDRAWSRALACGFLACFGVAAFRAYLAT